jgi:hypothetical protein
MVRLLLFSGLVAADPFWKFPKAQKFVDWATDAIPIIQETGDFGSENIELHNLADVVYTDLHGAKGVKIGKRWMIQAIYTNPERKFKFYCLVRVTKSPKRPAMEHTKVSCEQYRF